MGGGKEEEVTKSRRVASRRILKWAFFCAERNCHNQRRLKKLSYRQTDLKLSSYEAGWLSLFLGDIVFVVQVDEEQIYSHITCAWRNFHSLMCLRIHFHSKRLHSKIILKNKREALEYGKQTLTSWNCFIFLLYPRNGFLQAPLNISTPVLHVNLVTERIKINSLHSSSPHHSVDISTQIKLCLAPNNFELWSKNMKMTV